MERTYLNTTNDEYESIWIEINNEKSKNIVCGSIYRHPRNNNDHFKNFLQYLESSLNKLIKENKEIYLCGDFNIDLLKIEEISNYKNFYKLMSSYGLLPQIIQPTRECGNSSTIIDNIFTNNMSNSIQSGNILTDLSDHYSQFIMVNRDKLDFKTTVVYSRDYSKFSADSFRDDVSSQNFNVEFDNINDQFNDFYYKLKGCVDRHAPLKKLSQKETKLRYKPWISYELLKMINVRNKLFQRKKCHPNNTNVRHSYKL